MIRLEHIYKQFDDTIIFQDFNYEFEDNHFYLLFGPSGCGKTTLLNLIANIWEPDKGIVNSDKTDISYITQDCYFVDYLDAWDNLKLCTDCEEEIMSLVVMFGLESCIHQYPATLSGGEKQRLAVIRARLLKSKVLLLDEPTASLDKENSEKMFSILKELKQECLVICVTHDERAKQHCDDWIDFTNLSLYRKSLEHVEISCEKSKKTAYTTLLYPYIKKQNSYYKENTYVSFFLILLFSIALLLFGLLTNTESKLLASLGKDSGINTSYITCNIESKEDCLKGLDENVIEVIYPYSEAAVYYDKINPKPGESASVVDIPYLDSLLSVTLPKDKNIFSLSDHIAYGNYPTKENEVMLGYLLAEELANKSMTTVKELITTPIQITTPRGKETFFVSGIFQSFTTHEGVYLKSIQSDENSANKSYFFTNEYAMSYMNDEILSQVEKEGHIKFIYYFNDFNKMLNFENTHTDGTIFVYPVMYYFSSTLATFAQLEVIFLPLLIFLLIVTLMFYIFIRNVQIKYAKHIYSVYELCGASSLIIRKATMKYYVFHITKLYGIALISSFIIGNIINALNLKIRFLSFQPYRIDIVSTVVLLVLTITITVIFVWRQFLNYKRISAYDMLRERRDLL